MKSDAIVTALKAAAAAGVDTDDALDQLAELVENVHIKAPTAPLGVVLSEVPLGWNDKTCVVGWDTCSACKEHVSQCKRTGACKNGPVEPIYVTKFRAEKPVTVASALPTPVTKVNVESSLSRSSQMAVSSDGEAQDSLGGQAISTIDYHVCQTCKQEVSVFDGDDNDDGTFTCHKCQETSA